nr:C4-dicarboxylate ABC transporter [Candidatus Desulfobacula maris]
LKWFNSLPQDIRDGIDYASEVTMRQNHAKVPAARAYAMSELAKAGVEFYVPTASEKEAWVKASGAQLPAWDDIKMELIGSLSKFDKLAVAANTQGSYHVDDVKA